MTKDLKQLEKLAHEGDADAKYKLGRRNKYGEGVEQDDGQAVHWWHFAAEQGTLLETCTNG